MCAIRKHIPVNLKGALDIRGLKWRLTPKPLKPGQEPREAQTDDQARCSLRTRVKVKSRVIARVTGQSSILQLFRLLY
jgi:hypothetical protein